MSYMALGVKLSSDNFPYRTDNKRNIFMKNSQYKIGQKRNGRQIQVIKKAMSYLHEDLQFDYQHVLDELVS